MNNIYVTKPFFPPLNEFVDNLEKIWESGVLTNYGQFHSRLEIELKNYLSVANISLLNNGTMALIAALEVLHVDGEVITTPYSFVATSHALIWKRCKPVFVDVNYADGNIDPEKVIEAINSNTVAILAVHCYGFPCDVEKLDEIAKTHNLRLLYDAAHAFGVCYKGQSVLNYGDASVLSFHATKVFNTVEGGGVVFKENSNCTKIRKLSNFGFDSEISVSSVGLNFKLNEIQAAMGIVQLKHMQEIFKNRERINKIYDEELNNCELIEFLRPREFSSRNYSYYPILIKSNKRKDRDGLYAFLRNNSIYARRYFYPLINNLEAYGSKFSVSVPSAEKLSANVLCLPIYPGLRADEQSKVIEVVKKYLN